MTVGETKKQKGFTLWFTGLSGSGKSTIAERVALRLQRKGVAVEILDGDIVRTHLSKGLGFNREDRDENIKRVGFVCQLLTRNGVAAIASVISPYREARDYNRKAIGNFVEVYTRCPVEVCAERDLKGLYQKAKAGEIKGFTGVDDPYEPPLNPELVCHTDTESVDQSVEKVLKKLEELGYI
ncbi:MAG TPA: adenylyl-sulfate kinase [bacterium]|nr:adenylyl-sulfate kinase [bacterium]